MVGFGRPGGFGVRDSGDLAQLAGLHVNDEPSGISMWEALQAMSGRRWNAGEPVLASVSATMWAL